MFVSLSDALSLVWVVCPLQCFKISGFSNSKFGGSGNGFFIFNLRYSTFKFSYETVPLQEINAEDWGSTSFRNDGLYLQIHTAL